MTTAFEELLTGWITRQRWFAGKGRALEKVTVVSDVPLGPGLRHVIVAVRQNGHDDRYQLLIGEREDIPARLAHARIDTTVYDAVHDADKTGFILDAMARDAEVGPLRFRHVPGEVIDTSPRSLVIGAEQSNTSLVFGDSYICKLFRRLIPASTPNWRSSPRWPGRGRSMSPSRTGGSRSTWTARTPRWRSCRSS